MKGDIQRYVLSTISFLCDIGELRYWQNNTEQQNIEMVKYIDEYPIQNLISCIVLSVSRLPDIAWKTTCNQMEGDIYRYILSISSPLCYIG